MDILATSQHSPATEGGNESAVMLASSPNHLAEVLAALQMEPEEIAEEARLSLTTIQRIIQGGQASARTRARIIAVINKHRADQHLPDLLAAEIFPFG